MTTEKTPEQMQAFGRIALSAMRRRSWVEGEPLSSDEIDREYSVFRGKDA